MFEESTSSLSQKSATHGTSVWKQDSHGGGKVKPVATRREQYSDAAVLAGRRSQQLKSVARNELQECLHETELLGAVSVGLGGKHANSQQCA